MVCPLIYHKNDNILNVHSYLYTWTERGTIKVKCCAQEYIAVTPCTALTQTARSEVRSRSSSLIRLSH